MKNLPIEKQVCSPENAKRLKELGIRQKSIWHWQWNCVAKKWFLRNEIIGIYPYEQHISAFTDAELMTILSKIEYESLGFPMVMLNSHLGKWGCCFRNPSNWSNPDIATENIADAPAEYLIWLIENKHIKLEKV